jgi:hypothetical protein
MKQQSYINKRRRRKIRETQIPKDVQTRWGSITTPRDLWTMDDDVIIGFRQVLGFEF